MKRGYSLAETAAVLVIVSMTVASLAPAARRYRDQSRVVAAREAVAGVIARTRVAAVASGLASVTITRDSVRAHVGDSTLAALSLADYGVEVILSGGHLSTTLTYDALGLGRAASRTVRFLAGAEESRLVISSYGRIRR